MPNEHGNGTPTPIARTETAELPGNEGVKGSLYRCAARFRDVGDLLERAGDVAGTDGAAVFFAELHERLDELTGIVAGTTRAVGRLIEG